ncbi:class I SAM-dependent methyltransferase [Candidatus Auribacterota bacterium]
MTAHYPGTVTHELGPYGQYKRDIFTKLDLKFVPGKKMLDIGCGNGTDAEIFINIFELETFGVDVYRDDNIDNIKGLDFQQASILELPFYDDQFDYVFAHDVLHHIDEEHQSNEKHITGLSEMKRVTAQNGTIVIVEANRYNPLGYPNMVLLNGHDHWKQSYFLQTVSEVFPDAQFKFFEAHNYPWGVKFWKAVEFAAEKFMPKRFLAYNVAVIKNA